MGLLPLNLNIRILILIVGSIGMVLAIVFSKAHPTPGMDCGYLLCFCFCSFDLRHLLVWSYRKRSCGNHGTYWYSIRCMETFRYRIHDWYSFSHSCICFFFYDYVYPEFIHNYKKTPLSLKNKEIG